MKQLWFRVGLMAGALAVLGACASSQDGSAAVSSALRVHVGLTGGAVRPGGGEALSNASQPDVTVVVVNSTRQRWTAKTNQSGVADFSVPPGEYSVTSPACGPGPKPVTVKAGQPAGIQVVCAVP